MIELKGSVVLKCMSPQRLRICSDEPKHRTEITGLEASSMCVAGAMTTYLPGAVILPKLVMVFSQTASEDFRYIESPLFDSADIRSRIIGGKGVNPSVEAAPKQHPRRASFPI